jgi:tetratricopeptide (TPR) repeat protein
MHGALELLQRGKSVKRQRARRHYWALGKKVVLATVSLGLALFVIMRFVRRGGADYVQSENPEVNKWVDRGFSALLAEAPQQLQYASECFKKALDLEPKFVPALYGLASVELDEPSFRGRVEDLKKVAPHSAEFWLCKAHLEWEDRHYLEAVADGKHATELRAYCRAGRAWAHGSYGLLLEQIGDADDALKEYLKAELIYGDEPTILDHLGQPFYMRRNFPEALKHFRDSVRLQQNHANGLNWMARTHEEMGEFKKAIEEYEKADLVSGSDPEAIKRFYVGLRSAFDTGGAKGYWSKRLEEGSKKSSPDWYALATFSARLDDMDQAFKFLEQANQNEYCFESLMYDLCWDHNDERFKTFVKKVGLVR